MSAPNKYIIQDKEHKSKSDFKHLYPLNIKKESLRVFRWRRGIFSRRDQRIYVLRRT